MNGYGGVLFKKIVILTLLLGFISANRLCAAQDPDELYRKGRFSEAEKAYTQLDMDHPKDITYRYNRGCAQVMGSDYKGAMAAFSSVLKRTKDDGMRFKASYNMGVTTFKQGDFASAAEHFKDSIKYNPESKEAKYNLELSLRELDKQKKKKEENQTKKKGQKDKGTQKDPSQSKNQEEQKGKGQDKQSKKGEPDENQSKNQDNKGNEDKKGQNGNKKPEKGKQGMSDQDSNADKESPKDLKGKLSLKNKLHPEKDKGQNKAKGQPGVMLNRKKAEALLDNLKEDRSRFFRFQVPQDKRNVRSGKDW